MNDLVERWTGRLATLLCQAYRQRRPEYSDEQLAQAVLKVAPRSLYYWRTAPQTVPRPATQERLKFVLSEAPYDVRATFRDLLAEDTDTSTHDGERLSYHMHNPSSLDLVGIAELHQHIQDLDAKYDHVPSAALLPEAGKSLGQVAFLISNAPTALLRNQLQAVEAEAATLMGQMVWDASIRRDHATARAYFERGVEAARAVGDRVTEGHALLRKSYVALYGESDPQSGLVLTDQARSTILNTSAALAGLAVLHSADANAMLGRGHECQQALVQAEAAFDRARSDDPAGHLVSPTQFDRLAGSCYLYLGDLSRAERSLDGVAGRLTQHNKSRALILGNLSLARLRKGDLDAAAATLHEAIDVLEVNRAAGGFNKVFAAARELRRWRSEPVAQDVQDRLLSLLTTE